MPDYDDDVVINIGSPRYFLHQYDNLRHILHHK